MTLLYSLDELQTIRDNFLNELILAQQDKPTSLAFIKNPLPQQSLVNDKEIFQTLVVGGTVFKNALVKKTNNQINFIKQKNSPLPIFDTKNDFLAFFVRQIDPRVKIVGLNFAYHLQPLLRNGLLDGKFITPTKENRFSGLINKLVGQELENYVLEKIKRRVRVAVANDTICLLLSTPPSLTRCLLAAGVVGAGTNFAFYLDQKTIVNLESGNFDKFTQTESGKIIDKNSTNPGQQLFEKEVSGAYLYQHYNFNTDRNQSRHYLISTSELSPLAEKHNLVAQKLLERSASLIACQITGIYLFKKTRSTKLEARNKFEFLNFINPKIVSDFDIRNSDFSVVFVMEGSLFWHGWHYKQMVEKYLKKLGVSEKAIKFIKIENSSLIGASRLVTG